MRERPGRENRTAALASASQVHFGDALGTAFSGWHRALGYALVLAVGQLAGGQGLYNGSWPMGLSSPCGGQIR